MDEDEIEADKRADQTWRRPTWNTKDGHARNPHNIFLDDIFDILSLPAHEPQTPKNNNIPFTPDSEEYKALAILQVTWPITQNNLKKEYKKLAKKYHPDMQDSNNDDIKKQHEQQFKKINAAYHILYRYYQQQPT